MKLEIQKLKEEIQKAAEKDKYQFSPRKRNLKKQVKA
jgi:hypothetical protein